MFNAGFELCGQKWFRLGIDHSSSGSENPVMCINFGGNVDATNTGLFLIDDRVDTLT